MQERRLYRIGAADSIVGEPTESQLDCLKEAFINALDGCFEYGYKEQGGVPFRRVVAELLEGGFFEAPASTRFHEAFKGGLLLHSCRVYNQAISMGYLDAIQPENQRAFGGALEDWKVGLCALLHDVCKMGSYTTYSRNVKNEATGAWEKVQAYQHNSNKPGVFGHGETSAIRLLQWGVNLTDDMVSAIRWHMGTWDVSQSGMSDLGAACKKYPLVHLIQFADQLSVTTWRDNAENIL